LRLHPLRVLLPLFLALPSEGAAQAFRRLDPVLAELVQPDARERIRRLVQLDPAAPPETQPLGGTLALERAAPGVEPMIGVFLRVRGPGALERIRSVGGTVGAVLEGSLVSARVPLSALEGLAALADVESVEAARALRAEHDSSMKAIHVDGLRTRTGSTWNGLAGQGVIVGVYDTGLDVRHEDFIDAAGQTRVLGLWDQTTSGTPPPGFVGGHYCSRTDVQRTITSAGTAGCPQRDFHGHGTHVAGTAAGDGSSSPAPWLYQWAGVAPAAELLIVNGGPGIFFENRIIDGLTWMRQEGLRLGRPIVVNLSLGGQFGAHDGTRLYEKAIDALSGPGFIIVISAGNNGVNGNTTPPLGGALIHARGFATGTQATEFEMEVSAYTPGTDKCSGNNASISLWSEATDALRVEVVRPDLTSVIAEPRTLVVGESAAGRIRIDNASGGANPENGDHEGLISIDGCGTSDVPAVGTWKLRVTPVGPGSGQPYDLWIYSTTRVPIAGTRGFDNRFIVGSPGNANRAITVGAFVTRLCWPSVATSGQICFTQREAVGDLARFSAGGPTRDGRLKPEIAAPGLGVMSALSRDASTSQQRVGPDGLHSVREGTSMSAPHVVGAVAILLQAEPTLTPEDVRGALAVSAGTDTWTARTYGAGTGQPRDWWGFGKLNVRDALLALGDGTASVLGVTGKTVAPATTTLAPRGTRLPLLQLDFTARGSEFVEVTAIGFDVEGTDPGARLLLIGDLDSDGSIGATEPVVGSAAAALTGGTLRVVVRPTSLRAQPFGRTPVLVAVEVSGAAPNGASFKATFVRSELHSRGVRSGAVDLLEASIVSVTSGAALVTLLEPDVPLSFSANPVRQSEVFFNFAEPPGRASVYTLTGRRVVDLCGLGLACGGGTGGTRVRWDLRNEEGEPVAPAVYLVVFEVGGRVLREKLVILTPGRGPDGLEPQR
jgi:subtilisin family serine protease